MKTPSLLAAALLALSALAPAALPGRGEFITAVSGKREHIPAPKFKGSLLPTLMDYAAALRQGQQEAAGHYRRRAIDLARRFPEEVNDLYVADPYHSGDSLWPSPLSLAVQAQDKELVRLLLDNGARPLTSKASVKLSELAPLPGAARDPKVAELVERAEERCNPLLRSMPAPQRSLDPSAGKPYESPYAKLPPAHRKLAETYENTYIGEPGEPWDWGLYDAYRCLPNADTLILHVQKLTKQVKQPEKQRGYARITYTGRIVEALKGHRPGQAFIRWSIPHEGPVEGAPDGETVTMPPDQPATVIYANRWQDKEPAKVEGDTLVLGFTDPFDTWNDKGALARFKRVLADYPELRDTVEPTAEALRAAHAIMEDAPCLVRADIVEQRVEREGAAGKATLHATARLRDPLKGATIIGVVRDWSDIHYTRPLPEGAASVAEGTLPGPIPVILVLDTAGGTNRVLQAYDAVHETDIWRALNAAAFLPWREPAE